MAKHRSLPKYVRFPAEHYGMHSRNAELSTSTVLSRLGRSHSSVGGYKTLHRSTLPLFFLTSALLQTSSIKMIRFRCNLCSQSLLLSSACFRSLRWLTMLEVGPLTWHAFGTTRAGYPSHTNVESPLGTYIAIGEYAAGHC